MDPMEAVALAQTGLKVANGLANMGAEKTTGAQATQDQVDATKMQISDYQTFLKQFPAYQSYMEQTYQSAAAAQTGKTLESFAARGARMVGPNAPGGPTSAEIVAEHQKSLLDQGYTQLQNQLGNEQTQAKQQLKIYQTSVGELRMKKWSQEHPVITFFSNIGKALGL